MKKKLERLKTQGSLSSICTYNNQCRKSIDVVEKVLILYCCFSNRNLVNCSKTKLAYIKNWLNASYYLIKLIASLTIYFDTVTLKRDEQDFQSIAMILRYKLPFNRKYVVVYYLLSLNHLKKGPTKKCSRPFKLLADGIHHLQDNGVELFCRNRNRSILPS